MKIKRQVFIGCLKWHRNDLRRCPRILRGLVKLRRCALPEAREKHVCCFLRGSNAPATRGRAHVYISTHPSQTLTRSWLSLNKYFRPKWHAFYPPEPNSQIIKPRHAFTVGFYVRSLLSLRTSAKARVPRKPLPSAHITPLPLPHKHDMTDTLTPLHTQLSAASKKGRRKHHERWRNAAIKKRNWIK